MWERWWGSHKARFIFLCRRFAKRGEFKAPAFASSDDQQVEARTCMGGPEETSSELRSSCLTICRIANPTFVLTGLLALKDKEALNVVSIQPIAHDDEAKMKCPPTCKNLLGLRWNGYCWWFTAAGITSSWCQCEPEP